MDKTMGRGMVFNLGYRKMVQPALILLWTYILAGNLLAGGLAMQSETISTPTFRGSDTGLIEVFFDADNNMFFRATLTVNTSGGIHFLYADRNWVPVKQYGGLWNTFAKDGYFHIACQKDKDILIYRVQKDIELVSTVRTEEVLHFVPWAVKNVIPVSEQDNSYYLVTARSVFPTNPVEFLFDFASGGHGIYYVKPVLTEIQDGKPGKPQKLQYGGKRNETYYIKQVAQSGDFVHFLGFRQQEERAWGRPEGKFTPVILHHAAYDLKKKKVAQTNPIYTDTPRGEEDKGVWYRYAYGDFSIDALGDDTFIVFVWAKLSHPVNQTGKVIGEQYGEQYVESNILYWDSIQGRVEEAKKIADGFLPMVKADSLGNVHLLYVNDKLNLMHKVKRKGIWQKEEVLVDRVDAKPYVNNIAAAFDKDNNLHVVYPLDGNLIHAVLKVN